MTDTTTEAVERVASAVEAPMTLVGGFKCLITENTEAAITLRALAAERDALRAQLVTAQAQAPAARDALKWYAAEVADCRKIISDGNVARAKLDRDGGHRARTALTTTPRTDAATEE